MRLKGKEINPGDVIAGDKPDDTSGLVPIEIDLDAVILRHELEECVGDFRGKPFDIWILDHLRQYGVGARSFYLDLVQYKPEMQDKTGCLWGIFTSKPPQKPASWSWIETVDVRHHDEIITIVGHCIPVRPFRLRPDFQRT